MNRGEALELYSSMGRERYKDAAPIFLGWRALDETSGLQAICQAYGAMRSDLQLLRKLSHRDPIPTRVPLYGQ